MALEKTRMGKAHIDFLACGLAGFAPRLVIGLEKMYGIDFRASTDDTGNDVNGGDWKMETDNDYDVADDYLDRVKLAAYTEKMGLGKTNKAAKKQEKKIKEAAAELNIDVAITGGHMRKGERKGHAGQIKQAASRMVPNDELIRRWIVFLKTQTVALHKLFREKKYATASQWMRWEDGGKGARASAYGMLLHFISTKCFAEDNTEFMQLAADALIALGKEKGKDLPRNCAAFKALEDKRGKINLGGECNGMEKLSRAEYVHALVVPC